MKDARAARPARARTNICPMPKSSVWPRRESCSCTPGASSPGAQGRRGRLRGHGQPGALAVMRARQRIVPFFHGAFRPAPQSRLRSGKPRPRWPAVRGLGLGARTRGHRPRSRAHSPENRKNSPCFNCAGCAASGSSNCAEATLTHLAFGHTADDWPRHSF